MNGSIADAEAWIQQTAGRIAGNYDLSGKDAERLRDEAADSLQDAVELGMTLGGIASTAKPAPAAKRPRRFIRRRGTS